MDIPKIELTSEQRGMALELLKQFQVDGKRADLVATEGQIEIFAVIALKIARRVEIICATQYGKSLFVAFACICLTCLGGEKVCVVAPGQEQARIIMRYYIEHLGDHPSFLSRLEYADRNNYNRLRQDQSKARISLNNQGTIFVLSAQSKYAERSITAAMGQGAEVVIEDESCLISDKTEATIFRMISGKDDGMYVKIGNPFYRNHFLRDWQDEKYTRIFIDYKRALKEGRYNEEIIEEAQKRPLFSILYACEFPPEDEIDEHGYRQLLTTEDLKFSMEPTYEGEPILGCDIAGGGDYNVYVIRYKHYAFVAGKNRSNDTMTNVTEIIDLMKKYYIKDYNVNIDDIGIGRGVVDRLKEMDYNVNGVSVGGKTSDDRFSNLKARIYWDASMWVKNPKNFLRDNENWNQLTWIKYKIRSDTTIIIEPKEDLKRRTHQSPDFAEAFALTFADVGEEVIRLDVGSEAIYQQGGNNEQNNSNSERDFWED